MTGRYPDSRSDAGELVHGVAVDEENRRIDELAARMEEAMMLASERWIAADARPRNAVGPSREGLRSGEGFLNRRNHPVLILFRHVGEQRQADDAV